MTFTRRETAGDSCLKCIEGLCPGTVAETAAGSASAEVVDVDAELNTRSDIEIQAVKITWAFVAGWNPNFAQCTW